MNEILAGQVGVLVLIFVQDQQKHDSHLYAALQKIQEAGATLNPEKCKFSKQSLTFLGHIINQHGTSPDPNKTTTVLEIFVYTVA